MNLDQATRQHTHKSATCPLVWLHGPGILCCTGSTSRGRCRWRCWRRITSRRPAAYMTPAVNLQMLQPRSLTYGRTCTWYGSHVCTRALHVCCMAFNGGGLPGQSSPVRPTDEDGVSMPSSLCDISSELTLPSAVKPGTWTCMVTAAAWHTLPSVASIG